MQNSIQTGSHWDISNDLLVFQCTEVLTLTSLSIICEGEGIQFKELWADISNKLSSVRSVHTCESWRFQTISLLKGVFHLLWGDVVHELRVTLKPYWGGSRENLTPINLGIVIRHDFPRLKIDDHHHVWAAQLKPICSILGKLRFMDACFFLWEGFLEWVVLSFVHHSVQWGKWNALVLSELLDKMDRGPLECGATIVWDYGLA